MDKSYHHLFVLRAWFEDGRWRYSLKRSGEKERMGFTDLDSLYFYLSSLTQESGEDTLGPGRDAK